MNEEGYRVPKDRAEALENIGYDPKYFVETPEGIIQVGTPDKESLKEDGMFEKQFGISKEEALSNFPKLVDEYISIRDQETTINKVIKDGLEDRSHELHQRLEYIISIYTELSKTPGFVNNPDVIRFKEFVEQNGWY
jgi:hypothetical protein